MPCRSSQLFRCYAVALRAAPLGEMVARRFTEHLPASPHAIEELAELARRDEHVPKKLTRLDRVKTAEKAI